MKNILLTLALIVSFNLNSQTNSDVKSVFTNDLDKFFQYSSDKNFTKLFDLINPKFEWKKGKDAPEGFGK